MTSSRPAASARPRRMLIACGALIIACGTKEITGDDSQPREDGARVEVNGGRHKEARVDVTTDGTKAKQTEILSDSKDSLVEGNGRPPTRSRPRNRGHHRGPTVEINPPLQGYGAAGALRLHSHWRFGSRYLFGQEPVQPEEPPLPRSQFNPDPGGGNLLEPDPPPA